MAPRYSLRTRATAPSVTADDPFDDNTDPNFVPDQELANSIDEEDYDDPDPETGKRARGDRLAGRHKKPSMRKRLKDIATSREADEEDGDDTPANLPPVNNAGILAIESLGLQRIIPRGNLDRFRNLCMAGLRLKPGAAPTYTVNRVALPHVLDLELGYDGRRFEVLEDEVVLQSQDSSTGLAQAWYLPVQDKSRPQSDPLRLFNIAANNQLYSNYKPAKCLLTEDICPTAAEAVRLGWIVCDILNRFPGDLPLEWDTVFKAGKLHATRRFIDITALSLWQPGFDFAALNTFWIKPPVYTVGKRNVMPAAAYGTKDVIMPRSKTTMRMNITVACLYLDSGPVNITLSPNEVSASALDEADIPDRQPGWFFGPDVLPKMVDQYGQAASDTCARFLNFLSYSAIGRIGTQDQVRAWLKEQRLRFQDASNRPVMHTRQGSFGDNPVFGKPNTTQGRVALIPSRFVANLFELDLGDEQEVTSQDLAGLIVIETSSKSPIVHAYIRQQAIDALARGQDILAAFIASAFAADMHDYGVLDVATMKATYCGCSPAQRLTTEHYCMGDGELYLCSEMGLDANGNLLCRRCGEKGEFEEFTIRSLASTIHKLAWNCHYQDSRYATPNYTLAELEASFKDQISGEDWIDAYDGLQTRAEQIRRASSQTILVNSLTGRPITDPYRMSPDKLYDVWISGNKADLHHPRNTRNTKWCINQFRGSMSIAMLPHLKHAERLRQQADLLPLQQDYPEEQRADWQVFERASDNDYVIGHFFPYTRALRLDLSNPQTKFLAAHFQRIVKQCRSGVWDGLWHHATFSFATRKDNNAINQLATKLESDWTMFTAQETKEIIQLIDDFEASPLYNPHGLKIPRNKDRSPWFWPLRHQYKDADMEFLFWECRARLIGIIFSCNKNHPTDESPWTMLIEYAVEWLQTAGKCPIFGFIMVHFSGHPLNYSWGRGTDRLDDDGNVVGEIEAQEALATGCAVLKPTKIEHYKLSRRTMRVESWRANALRGNTPRSMLPLLLQAVQSISDATEYYGPRLPLDSYRIIQFPPFWRQKFELPGRDTSSDDDGDEDEDDEDEELDPDMQRRLDAEDDGSADSGDAEALAAARAARAAQARKMRQRQSAMEHHYSSQSTININFGEGNDTWICDFSLTDVSGESLRCMWRAISLLWYGKEHSWSQLHDIVMRTWNAVMHAPENTTNPTREARRQLYEQMSADNPRFVTEMTSAGGPRMGQVDTIQVIADVLDVQIFMYTATASQDETLDTNNVPAIGSWSITVRGRDHQADRQMHIINWMSIQHWQALRVARLVTPNVPAPKLDQFARVPHHSLDALPGLIPRLPIGHQDNKDLRPPSIRGLGSINDGHMPDTRSVPIEDPNRPVASSPFTKLLGRPRWDVGVPNPVIVGHPLFNVAVSYGRFPHDRFAYPTNDNTFLTEQLELVATYNPVTGEVFDSEGVALGTVAVDPDN